MSAWRRDGSRPEVDDATTTSGPAARLAAASRPHFTSATLRGASGSGSKSRTSTPLRTKRAAQPPPITPPPRRPAVCGRSATTPEPQLLAHLVGPEHPDVHALEDRDR